MKFPSRSPFALFLVLAALLHASAQIVDPVTHASDLARAGKAKEAEEVLRSAVAQDPDSAALHGALGKLLFTEANYPDAVQELNQAEQLDADSREYNMLLAASLLGAKRDGVARNFLLAIEPRFTQYPEFHYSLGLAYYNMAQIAKSEEELQKAIQIDPKMDRANFLLAACLASEGEFAKASTTLRSLVRLHPDNAIYWSTLADTLRQQGPASRPEALRACHKALALKPHDPHSQFVMATILLDAKDYAGARTLLEHLEQVNPREMEAHVQLARVYARLGKENLAKQESHIAAELQKERAAERSSSSGAADGNPLEQR